MAEQVHAYCPLCIARCGCIATVESGRLLKVDPDPGHPTGNSLCVKGRAAPEMVDSPHRLRHPLKRTQPKGASDPGWRRVSWEDALDDIASRLSETAALAGPEAVAFGVTTPSGTSIADAFGWIHRLAHAFGSPNVLFATENCNWHKDHAPKLTFGTGLGIPDFDRAGTVLLWGFNPAATWPPYANAALRAHRRGAKLVVADPRRAGLAAQADLWLPVRPGRDGVLALGIAGVMLAEGWYDEAFIRDWTNAPFLVREDGELLTGADLGGGADRRVVWDSHAERAVCWDPVERRFTGPSVVPALSGCFELDGPQGKTTCRPVFDHFREACAAWTPGRVATETGVPAEQVRATAKLLFEHRPVALYHWTGIAQQAAATQTGRAIALLHALTGSWEVPGGNVSFSKPRLNDIFGLELLEPGQWEKRLGRDARPLGPSEKGWVTIRDLVGAIASGKPYPVKALVNFGANFVVTRPHITGLDAALSALDLLVHIDVFENPTARFADYLLPAAGAWERPGLAAGFGLGDAGEGRLQWRPALATPPGEARSDSEIVFDLAVRLGLEEHFFDGDREAAIRHVLAPSGVTLETLRASSRGLERAEPPRFRGFEQNGFATPSRRVEIYSERLHAAGEDALPRFLPSAAPGRELPLILTCAKWPQFCHSQHRGVPSLRRRMPEPLVELHPEAAARRRIADGDWVAVSTAFGLFRARARLVATMGSEVVCAQYGWWESCRELGLPGFAIGGPENGSYNRAVSAEEFDPISGSNALRGIPCDVSPSAAPLPP